jgi:hypothetical protein
MALGILAALASGVLAFERLVTVETAYRAIAISVLLLALPGFVLNIITIVRIKGNDGA